MNGPVPMGAKFSAVHSGARAPMQFSNWRCCRIGRIEPTNGAYGNGIGTSNSIRTVWSSTASTESTPWNDAADAQPPLGSRQ